MKNFEKQLLPLQKDKVKLEKEKEDALKKIERCSIETKTCAANKDSVGEKKWKEKANETKKELSEIEKQIEEIEDKIKEIEENKSAETFKLRSEWENKIKEARKDLVELEASRDAKIQIYKQEIEKLEGLTANIIQQINNVTKLREEDLANLKKLGIQQKVANPNSVYMPFYLVCYQTEMKKRYAVFPPMAANSIGFSAKIKSALGKAKIKQLLTPRFKAITLSLEKLPASIERDAAFAREIHEIGERADMLKTSSARKSIIKGLEKLREEGWLSEKEHEALSQKLA
jgi:DNA repair exonuclease SbcCD ATPase subunit